MVEIESSLRGKTSEKMFSRPVDPLWTERQKKLDHLDKVRGYVFYNGQGLETDLIKVRD
jgi:hypothetical protein